VPANRRGLTSDRNHGPPSRPPIQISLSIALFTAFNGSSPDAAASAGLNNRPPRLSIGRASMKIPVEAGSCTLMPTGFASGCGTSAALQRARRAR
jgi:hypothetical protein